MASASSLLSEEQFLCSICLDVFTDPVAILCGHNYCKSCITHYWDTSDVCKCPLCTKTFHKRPEVYINTFISEIVHQFRSHKWKEEYEAKTDAEIHQMIRERQLKIQELKHSVELSKRDADREIEDSRQIFTALVSYIERSHAKLICVIEGKQKTTEKRAESLIKDMKKELAQLEKRSSELRQLSRTEEHLQNSTSINTPPPAKDCTNIKVHPSSYVGTVRTAVAQLEKTLSQEMQRKLCDVELRKMQQYAVDVTLDPDTAHCKLILSEDGKRVNRGATWKNLPNNTERFSNSPCVLGNQSFSSGRFYYEVQVKGKTDWSLGVARESINRKGTIKLTPKNGYWTIRLRNGNEYKAHAEPDVLLTVREALQKVGVLVDYEEGLVSFYDVETRVHIYSFTGCTFTERLYPYFCPELTNNGKNSAPLIISPVNMHGH